MSCIKTISLLKYIGDSCETSPVFLAKSYLGNVGKLEIILDISVAKLLVHRPSRSVVVSSNIIHCFYYKLLFN